MTPPPPHSHSAEDDDDAGLVGSRRTGETGLVVTESAGPGADSIICTVRPPHEPASVGRIRREIVADNPMTVMGLAARFFFDGGATGIAGGGGDGSAF